MGASMDIMPLPASFSTDPTPTLSILLQEIADQSMVMVPALLPILPLQVQYPIGTRSRAILIASRWDLPLFHTTIRCCVCRSSWAEP
jgi:hypothetical protein